VFVGEQPGDTEDLAGRPFAGPAGRVFDKALEAVGIARDRVYEFLFVNLTERIRGATGSPVRPVAIR